MSMPRRGKPDKNAPALHVFGATFDDEAMFDGFTIPRAIIAGWHYGDERWGDGQFIRYVIDRADYR
jgi:hypothetical protein